MPFGYRYCGPGTDVEAADAAGGPIDKLDSICRQHDIDLGSDSDLTRSQADHRFQLQASKEGFVGNLFAGLVSINSQLANLPGGNILPGGKSMQKTPKAGPSNQQQPGPPKKRLQPREPRGALQPKRLATAFDESAMDVSGSTPQEAGTGGTPAGNAQGGQVPQMDPSPIKDGKVTLMFSRTFRHYIDCNEALNNKDPNTNWDMSWSIIPYEGLICSLKPRDWQFINTMAKRWRVLTQGFKMEHIIPFINDEKSTGGAVGPHITFNLMPYMESYIDKQFQLPTIKITNDNWYPNNLMHDNDGKQKDCMLKKYTPQGKAFIGYNEIEQNANMINYNYSKIPYFDLMNSKEWGTIQPNR